MQQLELVIHNLTGLHARPARVLVDIAKQYKSTIRLCHGQKQANAKSLISVLTLGVTTGQSIRLDINGEDEEAAASALVAAVLDGLGEKPGEAHQAEATTPAKAGSNPDAPIQAEQVAAPATSQTGMIKGVPGAPGIAIGPLFRLERQATDFKMAEGAGSGGAEYEQLRLDQALETARRQLEALAQQLLGQGASSEAAIFEVHRDILQDPALLEAVGECIKAGFSAAQAWHDVINRQAQQVARLSDALLAERATDLVDVGERVLRALMGGPNDQSPQFDTPVIIVAHDLTPSQTAGFDPKKVLGFCTAVGGPNAHTAILARAMGLPAVVSAGSAVLELAPGTSVILNGQAGTIVVSPDEAAMAGAREAQQQWLSHKKGEWHQAALPATTLDGHTVEVAANIGGLADATAALEAGAQGVGLFRTEFLFLDRTTPPTENEQFEIYGQVARVMAERGVIIRTLDIGGDKPIPYLNLPAEENPFLGLRGIRLCLAYPALFKTQLRAILRAARYGKLRIMFPMVADTVELRAVKALIEEVRAELEAAPLEIGIMIEIPSAALLADLLAGEVDFFSIGTNDLTQYTLAMDRTHPDLAGRADGLHPAVLRLIKHTVEAAHRAGKWVGICGELGSDPQAVPILVGLGVDELSVGSRAVPSVKAQIRTLKLAGCQQAAQAALNCATAQEVRTLTGE